MIDSFNIKADKASNRLIVQLRGFFMKSELELAFYLARKESKKLKEGFEVVLDLDGMNTDKLLSTTIHTKARKIFTTLGAGRVRTVGALLGLSDIKRQTYDYLAFDAVGFYPN